ncbi:MAG: hypothetical protein JO148_08275 [Acidimicrobiia bacterium]|nr:hypothetical protein [Acidimicrobiia bacterium]
MRWPVRLGAVLAVLAASVAPAGAAQASVRTPGAVAGPTTGSSTNPNCNYSLDTWPSTKGDEVTALHITGAWSCHSPGVSAGADLELDDTTLENAQNSGVIVGYANSRADGMSGSVRVDYLHPRTGHAYDANLTVRFDAYPVTAKSSGPCSRTVGSGDSYTCGLEQQYIVQTAPPVGPPPMAVPAKQTATLGMSNGQSCELDVAIADAGPGELSYSGTSTPTCPLNNIVAQTFAYSDQREPGEPVADGNVQCSFCSEGSTSGGSLPAAHSYTVTYYVDFLVLDAPVTFTSLPPQCSTGGSYYVVCEVTASVNAR